MTSFWATQPFVIRFFLLAVFATAISALVRVVRVALRLHRFSGEPLSPEAVSAGSFDPDTLARCALANRLRLDQHQGGKSSVIEPREAQLRAKRLAEARFSFMLRKCRVDVKSTKQACILGILLSVLVATWGAYPMYFRCYNDAKVSGISCLIVSGQMVLADFSLCLFVCTVVYAMSSSLDRALDLRKLFWHYFLEMVDITSSNLK